MSTMGRFLAQALAEAHVVERPVPTYDPAKIDDSRRDLRDLEQRLAKLTLICLAMWSLVQEKTDLKEEDLLQRVKDIDLLDGSADGRVTPQIAKCSQCNRVMNPRHTKCIYCGAEKLHITAFDEVV